MSKTYGRRGPRLSRVPGERAVQQYVLGLSIVFVLFILSALPPSIVTWARYGGNPTEAQSQAVATQTHRDWVVVGFAIAISLAGLWGIAVTARNRAAIRSVTGLKTQYVLAGPVTMFYSLVVHAWVGLAAGLAMALIALATKTLPPDQRTGRIEWSAGGER